jgi:hypothetical protein
MISLRPFPYPYRAAFSICSDIDLCNRKRFIEIHRFLNDTQNGLGLPVADSFFGCAMDRDQLGFLKPDGETLSSDAQFIQEAITSGLIDAIHSWADFNEVPPDDRIVKKIATGLAQYFIENNLSVKVWINHGSSRNYHNFRSRSMDSFSGDNPDSPFYTLPLAQSMGVRYVWPNECTGWPLSVQKQQKPVKRLCCLLKNEITNWGRLFFGRYHRKRPSSHLTTLCRETNLRDGTTIWDFVRYNYHPHGIWTLPTRHTLRYSLCASFFERLICEGGYAILYCHLGLPLNDTTSLFPPEDKAALELLATKYHDGLIWVTPTSTLLTYYTQKKSLTWHVSGNNEITIRIHEAEHPEKTIDTHFYNEYAGLTFYTPNPEETTIMYKNKMLDVNIYPPDYTGMPSIGIPLSDVPDTGIL